MRLPLFLWIFQQERFNQFVSGRFRFGNLVGLVRASSFGVVPFLLAKAAPQLPLAGADNGVRGNPQHFEGSEVPTSVMAQDLLTTYKYGWKTSYYQNTYDVKTDEVESDNETPNTQLDNLIEDIMCSTDQEEACESCAI